MSNKLSVRLYISTILPKLYIVAAIPFPRGLYEPVEIELKALICVQFIFPDQVLMVNLVRHDYKVNLS